MQAGAYVNDLEKFGQVADPRLDNIVAENHDSNTAFVRRYFDNPEFQAAVKEVARKRPYDLILSPARDEALRRLRALRSPDTQSCETVTPGEV